MLFQVQIGLTVAPGDVILNVDARDVVILVAPIVPIPAIFVLESRITALDAPAVPGVTPSNTPISAEEITVEPIVKFPLIVRLESVPIVVILL